MQERTRPNDIDAEMRVLGCMLQGDGGFEARATIRTILNNTDYYKDYHGDIYLAILELHDSGLPVDDLLAPPFQRIYKKYDRIADMTPSAYIEFLKDSAPSAANVEYYTGKVKEAARLREIIRVTNTINAKAYQADIDGISSADLVSELQDAITKNEVITSATGKVPTAKDDWSEVFKQLCQGQQSEYLGLRTGSDKLDKATLGLRGLSVLGGIPGQGKSSIALQIATEIARLNGVPVLFYSLEMSKFDLYIKTISRLSKLDYTALVIGSEINGRRGQGLSEDDTHKLNEGTAKFMEYADKVKIIDRAVCRDISLSLVRLHIQQAKREFGTDRLFLVLDHLQVFPVDKPRFDDMKQRLDYLVAEFKAISEQLNATILLISEKNRSSYEKEWLGAFMGSAGIEYGVDLAMLLHEPGEDKQQDRDFEDKDERKIELKIVKNRFGRRANIQMKFHPAFSAFEET